MGKEELHSRRQSRDMMIKCESVVMKHNLRLAKAGDL